MIKPIHAAADKGPRPYFLCGGVTGRATEPKEHPTCTECREILRFTADRYPERFDYQDMRMTASERREVTAAFVADMCGGADD